MTEIADHGDADLEMIQVPAGKQSADIHIGSYLGFLSNKPKNCSVVIISKDADFDNVIKFWRGRTGLNASRAQRIQKIKQKQPAKKAVQVGNPATKKITSEERKLVNSEVMKMLSQEGYSQAVTGKVGHIVALNLDKKDGKQLTYRSIIKECGQKKGLAIYSLIKDIL